MRQIASILTALLLVFAGAAVPASAAGMDGAATKTGADAARTAAGTNNSTVNVTVGQQLSTVLAVTSDDVQSEVDETGFEMALERGDETSRAEAIAERAETLRERSQQIHEDYREATRAYEAGELSTSEYARRLAALNARASNVVSSYERLRQRATTVSKLDLRAAGYNRSAVSKDLASLDAVTGAGTAALLRRYTGESEGEIELETDGGLSVSVRSEDGERSREIERPRDADPALTASQSAALDAARATLTTPETGSWVLTAASVDTEAGAYRFAFALSGASASGEAEVSVDGSSGEVYSIEEEIERSEDGESEDGESEEAETGEAESDEDESGDELALVVTEGTLAPGETVTVKALANGQPAASVPITFDDERVGTTGSDGTLTLTLPRSGEVELTARSGDAEGELSATLGEDESDVFRNMSTSATLDGDTATVTVSYDGAPVENAVVYANGERVGTTDADGTVTFPADSSGAVALEVVKGEFEAELGYDVQNGQMTLVESPHADDDSDSGDDSDAEESETESETDTDEEETETDSEDADEQEAEADDTETEARTEDEDETESTETESAETESAETESTETTTSDSDTSDSDADENEGD